MVSSKYLRAIGGSDCRGADRDSCFDKRRAGDRALRDLPGSRDEAGGAGGAEGARVTNGRAVSNFNEGGRDLRSDVVLAGDESERLSSSISAWSWDFCSRDEALKRVI